MKQTDEIRQFANTIGHGVGCAGPAGCGCGFMHLMNLLAEIDAEFEESKKERLEVHDGISFKPRNPDDPIPLGTLVRLTTRITGAVPPRALVGLGAWLENDE